VIQFNEFEEGRKLDIRIPRDYPKLGSEGDTDIGLAKTRPLNRGPAKFSVTKKLFITLLLSFQN
jgi:hypothetical protein